MKAVPGRTLLEVPDLWTREVEAEVEVQQLQAVRQAKGATAEAVLEDHHLPRCSVSVG